MKLSILGPPGSGKTTQAARISRLCWLAHIYPGESLRREAESDSPFSERIRSHLDAGLLVPSDIVIYLIERDLAASSGRYILDGFPRTMSQAVELELVLRERVEKLDAVILLEVRTETIVERLLSRGRPDDTPGLIAKRLEVFHAETGPVLEFYKQGGVLLPVCGEGGPDRVTTAIVRVLGEVMPAKGSALAQR